jgi:hypothetical protein
MLNGMGSYELQGLGAAKPYAQAAAGVGSYELQGMGSYELQGLGAAKPYAQAAAGLGAVKAYPVQAAAGIGYGDTEIDTTRGDQFMFSDDVGTPRGDLFTVGVSSYVADGILPDDQSIETALNAADASAYPVQAAAGFGGIPSVSRTEPVGNELALSGSGVFSDAGF